MGGLVTLRLLTGKPVTFHVDIFPFDLRRRQPGLRLAGESALPDALRRFQPLLRLARGPGTGNTHVMSKTPDSQAAADKAAIMAWGASLGQRHFGAAGTLSLDEIFSAEQLLVDIEIRDWLQAAIQGPWLGEEVVDDWLAEIRAASRTFVGLDSTLDHYRPRPGIPAGSSAGPSAAG